MWQVIYIATIEKEAKEIEKKLNLEGFLVKIETTKDGSYQLKVPESEAEEVFQYINENL
jgi:hypothetical protein